MSACLLGEPVRYDGEKKEIAWVREALAEHVEIVAICPEVGAGMPVPRPPIELVILENQSLHTRLVQGAGDVHTPLEAFCSRKLAELEECELDGYLFKARSPSCGVIDTPYFSESGEIARRGPGLWARDVMTRWPEMPIADESNVATPEGQSAFLLRVRDYWRRRQER